MHSLFRSLLLLATVSLIASAQIANHLVISEVYGGGGNSGATLKNDFIELYNPTDSAITVDGWSVQYASASGTSWQVTTIQGMIAPKGYYLVQEAQGTGGTVNLPTPDAIGAIAMSSSSCKVALAKKATAISGKTDVDVVDFVGIGTATDYEGTAAVAAISNTTSAERKASSTSTAATMAVGGADEFAGNGYDTNNNGTDFVVRTGPQPQNSASGTEPPSSTGDIIPPTVLTVKPLSSTSIEVLFNEAVDSLTSSTSTNYTMNKSISVSQALRDGANLSRVLLTVTTMVPDVYTLTISGVKDTAGNVMPTSKVIQFSYGTLTMAQARAAGAGAMVRVRGIVTVANEFASPSFLQDTTGAMGVYNTKFSTSAKVGDIWEVAGTIQNYYGLFEINPLTDSVKISSGNALPKPKVITSSQLGESLEGQLVRVNKVKFALSGNFGSATADSAYMAGDASGSLSLYIDKDTNIPSSLIPTDSVNVVGIVTQFVGGYQLQPRSLSDIGVVDPPPDQTWMSIIAARGLSDGSSVTIRGIVTFAQPSSSAARTVYIQDATGGISSYHPATDTLVAGDSVQVSGKLSTYHSFLEINPVDSLVLFARGLQLPPVKTITITTASESYESQLVKLDEVRFVETGTFQDGTSGANYHVSDGANQLIVRIPKNSLLTGTNIPVGAVNATGVLAQFDAAYQLTPRSPADLVPLPGPQIVGPPAVSNLSESGFTVSWVTLLNGNSVLAYGLTPVITDTVKDGTPATTHSFTLSGLRSGRVYYVKVLSSDGSGTSVSNVVPVVTTSPASSGTMNVYFNYSTDATLGLLPAANGSTALMDKLLERIGKATKSIDLALYSFDDFGGNPAVVAGRVADSLVAAKGRGVAVRMVFDNKATTTPLAKLITAGVSVIKRSVPGTDNGIMHNKFFVFDGRDTTSATDDWVVTGSWNVTNEGTTDDAQNAVFIQDQSLARIYELEFEEMFGSSTETGNVSVARFGPTKQNNTPHFTYVGGKKVEVYFSPSDQTTSHIIDAIGTADKNIFFGLLAFTRDDIASALISRHNAGVVVRGLIDQQPSVLGTLQGAGVDALQAGHSVVTGLFHHKYGVVDPYNDDSDPQVITGSHNWSSAAENDNDENTLVIHSGEIARQYVQEFSNRYHESGGTGPVLSVERTSSLIPATPSLSQNYPNPFNPATNFELRVSKSGFVSVRIFDLLGREVATLVSEHKAAGVYTIRWDASKLASGMYLCTMTLENFEATRKVLLVR